MINKEEFNLSEEIQRVLGEDILNVKHVKTFIKKEAELINKLVGEEIEFDEFCYERAKLLGDDYFTGEELI